MRKLLLILLTFPFLIFSEEASTVVENNKKEQIQQLTNHSMYFSLGTGLPIPLPLVGIGYRYKGNIQGVDVSLRTFPRFAYQGSVSYLIFPSKRWNQQMYFGPGISSAYIDIFGERAFFLSPQFVFGGVKLNNSNQFYQVELLYPQFKVRRGKMKLENYPAIMTSYGWMF